MKNDIIKRAVAILMISVLSILCFMTGCDGNVSEMDIPKELAYNDDTSAMNTKPGKPIIHSISPLEGRIGTEITITGESFGAAQKGCGVSLGLNQLEIITWNDKEITAILTPGSENGTIEIKSAGGKAKFKENEITIQKEVLQQLASKKVDSKQDNVLSVENNLTVVLPEGSIDKNGTLAISAVKNGPSFNSSVFQEGRMYEISLDKNNTLNEPAAIEFQLLEGEDPHNLAVCYWDENAAGWVFVPSMLDKEKKNVMVITDHFSHWLIVHLNSGGAIISGDYFITAYTPGDTVNVPGITDIKDLAVKVTDYLKTAYEKYDKALGSDYVQRLSKKDEGNWLEQYGKAGYEKLSKAYEELRGNYGPYSLVIDDAPGADKVKSKDEESILSDLAGLRSRMVVELNSKHNKYGASGGTSLKWAQKTIYIPTSFKNEDDLKTTLAHELFHNIQRNNFYGVEMGGHKSMDSIPIVKQLYGVEKWFERKILGKEIDYLLDNLWIIEATAEYASWGIAFPESKPKELHIETMPANRYDFISNRGSGQEYGMSFFIEYVLNKGDKSFKNLFKYLVDSRPDLDKALNTYAEAVVKNSALQLYIEFWKDMFTLNSMPKYIKNGVCLKGTPMYNQNMERKGPIKSGAVEAHFSYPNFPDNCETVVVSISPEGGKMPELTSVSLTQVDNFKANSINDYLNDPFAERKNTPPKWTMMTNLDVVTHYYATFNKGKITPENRQALIMVYNAFGKHSDIKMKMETIDMKITPNTVDKIAAGEQITFAVDISNIFPQAKSLELVWDFGDGKSEAERFDSHKKSIKSKIKHKYENQGKYTVKVSLYDTYNTGKPLIAERVLNGDLGQHIGVKYSPDKPSYKDEISFKAEGKTNWYYVWEFGDNQSQKGAGMSQVKYKYSTAGKYIIKVTAYEDDTLKKVAGAGTIAVEPDNGGFELTIKPGKNLEAKANDTVEISVESSDPNKPLKNYKIFWITKDAERVQEDGARLLLKYTVPGSYTIEAKAMDEHGNAIAAGTASIRIVNAANDPYRKHDSGFFPYDYDKLYFQESDGKVVYYDLETKRSEGMLIEFYDKERTKPHEIEYRYMGKSAGRDTYHENGQLASKNYNYTQDGAQMTDEFSYEEDGTLSREVHTRDGKLHGRRLLTYIQKEKNTQIIEETEFTDGKKNGVDRKSHEHPKGTEPVWVSVIEYRDDVLHGSRMLYFPDGSVKESENYIEGKREGENLYYSMADDGTIFLFRQSYYDKGVSTGKSTTWQYIKGKTHLHSETEYKNGITSYHKYYNITARTGLLFAIIEEFYDETGKKIKRIYSSYNEDGSLNYKKEE